jgi:predicted ThiF/HesA family dinucleotide-utilizing enzyme
MKPTVSRLVAAIAIVGILLTQFSISPVQKVHAAAWTPASLGGTLGLWLDASDASTITSAGGLVSQWSDKSGNGRHATQPTSGSQPTYTGTALSFGSSSRFMSGAMAANSFPTSMQVTVVSTSIGSNTYWAYPFNRTLNNKPAPFDLYNTTVYIGTGDNIAGYGDYGVNFGTLTTRSMVSTTLSASKIEQFLNGTNRLSKPGSYPYGDGSVGLYQIATRADRVTQFTGEINEIIVTNELSNSDRVNLESYLAAKWSIAGVPTPPAMSTAPTITGLARTGETLTTSNGTWTGTPSSYSYQWQRAATSGGVYSNIASATNSTYVVSDTDAGYFIKSAVIATNGVGSSSAALSTETAAVIDIAPINRAIPVVTGTARTGSTLTSSSGTWASSPTSYSYQWQRAATSGGVYSNIASATSSTYVVSDSDVGYFVKVSVVATNGVGSSSAALSSETAAITDIAPTNTAIPVVTGVARTGETLTASRGSWTSAPSGSTTYTYQWKRATTSGGTYSNIGSATSRTYELTDTDIDKYIKVAVIATNSIGASTAALSAATSVVVDLADSVVPTASTPVATTSGFTFTISNYSASYTYVLTTTNGSVSRLVDDVAVTGLVAGESATVTIAVTRTNYKPASKTVSGSALPAPTTTTAAPGLSIVIQAPVSTVAQGQASVATVVPTTTTLPVLGANGVSVPTTTTTSTTIPKTRAVVRATTTTMPAIVKNAAPVPPSVAKVEAGQSAVQVDGVQTDAVVTRQSNQMVVNAGSMSATLSGLDATGKRLALDNEGNVHLSRGDVIKVSVGGFKPDSVVEVWLFSTPTKLGSAVVSADGTMNGTYRLPFGVKSGSHRVVVTAKMANGKPTTFTLGILVGDISKTSTLTRILIAIPISIAIGFGFVLPTQLRRRRSKKVSHV